MPTPPEGPTSDVEDMGAESSGGREDVAAGDATPHAGTPRWTDEDWRRWNAGTWSWDQGRDGLPSTGTASARELLVHLMRDSQLVAMVVTRLGGQAPFSQTPGANLGGTPGLTVMGVVRKMRH